MYNALIEKGLLWFILWFLAIWGLIIFMMSYDTKR